MYSTLITEFEQLIADATLLVPMYPKHFSGEIDRGREFTSYHLLFPGNKMSSYRKGKEFRAMVYIDIFTPFGYGDRRSADIAENLDNNFEFQCLPSGAQTLQSSFSLKGNDPDNSSLLRAEYRVPLLYYGESS